MNDTSEPVHVGGCNAACGGGRHAFLKRCRCGRGFFTYYSDDSECADCFFSRVV